MIGGKGSYTVKRKDITYDIYYSGSSIHIYSGSVLHISGKKINNYSYSLYI